MVCERFIRKGLLEKRFIAKDFSEILKRFPNMEIKPLKNPFLLTVQSQNYNDCSSLYSISIFPKKNK